MIFPKIYNRSKSYCSLVSESKSNFSIDLLKTINKKKEN